MLYYIVAESDQNDISSKLFEKLRKLEDNAISYLFGCLLSMKNLVFIMIRIMMRINKVCT